MTTPTDDRIACRACNVPADELDYRGWCARCAQLTVREDLAAARSAYERLEWAILAALDDLAPADVVRCARNITATHPPDLPTLADLERRAASYGTPAA